MDTTKNPFEATIDFMCARRALEQLTSRYYVSTAKTCDCLPNLEKKRTAIRLTFIWSSTGRTISKSCKKVVTVRADGLPLWFFKNAATYSYIKRPSSKRVELWRTYPYRMNVKWLSSSIYFHLHLTLMQWPCFCSIVLRAQLDFFLHNEIVPALSKNF